MKLKSIEETMKTQTIKYQTTQKLIRLVSEQGFKMYEPEYFESYDRFVLAHKRIDRQRMVKLMNQSGDVLILRPDVTSSIASKIVPLLDEEEALKLFYYATTFRENNQGWIDSRKQFGVEWFNAKAFDAEIEVLRLIIAIFESFQLKYMIEIGSEAFLKTLFNQLRLSSKEEARLKELIALKDEYGLNQWLEETQIDSIYKSFLNRLFRLQGNPSMLREWLADKTIPDVFKKSLEELYNVTLLFKDKPIRVDLSMISEFEYYTGIRFKVVLENTPKSVLKGGRYCAVNPFGNESITAIGFSMDSDALLKELMKNV